MSAKCKNCGEEISEKARFCRRCGAEQKHDGEYVTTCQRCGGAVPSDAAFCRHCGVALGSLSSETGSPPSTATPSPASSRRPRTSQPRAKTAPVTRRPAPISSPAGATGRKKGGALGAIVALLALAVFFSFVGRWLPWPEDRPNGDSPNHPAAPSASNGYTQSELTGLQVSEADLNVPGENATVSPEQPEITMNGVTVSFGGYNLEEERVLTVKRLSAKVDTENEIALQPYDFTLEGISEFLLPVTVEMAYEPVVENDVWETNNVFVQYFDRATKGWSLVPSWVNADRNTVTLLTNHFSTFGVFQDVKAKDPEGAISLFRYSGPYRGPTTPVYTTGNAIDRSMAYVDESIFQKFIDTRAVPVRDATSNMLEVLNHGTSGTSYYLLAASEETYQKLNGPLGKAGMLFVFSKIAYQWHNDVATEDIILDNAFNLTEMALAASASAFAAPELAVAAAGVWAVGLGYDVGTLGYQYITDSDYRYVAYRNFSESASIMYVPDIDSCVYFRECIDSSYPGYDADYLKSGRTVMMCGERGWAEAFDIIQQKYKDDPRKIRDALLRLLESYLDVFWNTDGNEILRYLGTQPAGFFGSSTMADGWQWPTVTEESQYKAAYRERMKEFLKPIMKAMSQKALLELREQTYQAVLELWPLLNELISFEVQDKALPAGKFFPSSSLAGMHLELSPLSDKAVQREWICGERHERSNAVFTCNLYAYIKAGCPTKLTFWKPQGDSGMMELYMTVDFELSIPTTVIVVSQDTEVKTGIYVGHSSGKRMDGWSFSDLRYPAVRIAETNGGLLIGPCLENGDYDANWQVPCVYNPVSGRYEGEKQLERGKDKMELFLSVDGLNDPGKTLHVNISQTLSPLGVSFAYVYDELVWKGPIAGDAVTGEDSFRGLLTSIQP